jgi:hypothetical protein
LYPLARHQGLVVELMEDEVLVYDRQTHHAHHLNRTVKEVWRACDGTRSEAQLLEHVSASLGREFDRGQLEQALHQLEHAGLLERDAGTEQTTREKRSTARPRSLSRRRLLKGIAVAVPVITTILTPTIADAASCSGAVVRCTRQTIGQPCRRGNRCGVCRSLGIANLCL